MIMQYRGRTRGLDQSYNISGKISQSQYQLHVNGAWIKLFSRVVRSRKRTLSLEHEQRLFTLGQGQNKRHVMHNQVQSFFVTKTKGCTILFWSKSRTKCMPESLGLILWKERERAKTRSLTLSTNKSGNLLPTRKGVNFRPNPNCTKPFSYISRFYGISSQRKPNTIHIRGFTRNICYENERTAIPNTL